MKIIGLTGIIGTGKSTVAKILKQKGFVVIDADKVGHELLRNSKPIQQKLINIFGTYNRAKLGQIVFNSPKNLQTLNKIMHPEMKKLIQQKIQILNHKPIKGIVLEAAILLRMNLLDLIDELWLVNSSLENIYKRLSTKLTPTEIKKRLKNAYPLKDMQKKADFIINNNNSLKDLVKNIEKLLIND